MPEDVEKKTAWAHFEDEVFEKIRSLLVKGGLPLNPSTTKVFQRRAYFSKDRGKDIVFDIAMEAVVPPSKVLSVLWLLECKNYPTRKVKVDELEEFFVKMQQVGAHKGTVVTRLGFEEGAVAFARSKGVGLAVLNRRLEYVTSLAVGGPLHEVVIIGASDVVLTTGDELRGEAPLLFEELIRVEARKLSSLA